MKHYRPVSGYEGEERVWELSRMSVGSEEMNANNSKATISEFLIENEAGKGTVWSMLFCTIAIGAYLKVGRAWLLEHAAPFHHSVLVLTVGIITIFTLGCALHMIFVGDKSARQLRRDLKRQVEELNQYVAASQKRIQEIETRVVHHVGVIRPYAINSLGSARRITNAIKRRAAEVSDLLASRSRYDLIDAHELLMADLDVRESAVESLIGSDPLPRLAPEEWLPNVEHHCAIIEQELERIAA